MKTKFSAFAITMTEGKIIGGIFAPACCCENTGGVLQF